MKKDFTQIKEKNVTDCHLQKQPIHLLELFGGIGVPRRALENSISEFIKVKNPDKDFPLQTHSFNRGTRRFLLEF